MATYDVPDLPNMKSFSCHLNLLNANLNIAKSHHVVRYSVSAGKNKKRSAYGSVLANCARAAKDCCDRIGKAFYKSHYVKRSEVTLARQTVHWATDILTTVQNAMVPSDEIGKATSR